MRKNKVNKIRLLNEESDLEVTSDMINAYKTNSAKKRVTKKGPADTEMRKRSGNFQLSCQNDNILRPKSCSLLHHCRNSKSRKCAALSFVAKGKSTYPAVKFSSNNQIPL